MHDTDFDLDNYNFLFRNLDEKKLYHILNLADNYILDYNAKFNVKLGKNSFFKELEGIFVEQNLTNILSNLYSDKLSIMILVDELKSLVNPEDGDK